MHARFDSMLKVTIKWDVQKFEVGKFLKVSNAQQGCIYLIRNSYKYNIVKYYYNLNNCFLFECIFKMYFIPVNPVNCFKKKNLTESQGKTLAKTN